MNTRSLLVLAIAASSIAASSASAAPVYMLTSGDATLDQLYVAKLNASGHSVTIGPAWYQLASNPGFPAGGVVLVLANSNWGAGSRMPSAGQTALLNYITQGGGLITTEWLLWRAGSGSPGSALDILYPAFAATSASSTFRTTTTLTYTQVAADPILNAGLPGNITFVPDSFSGTESLITPRAGAIEFYHSDTYGSGLVGWSYNRGRTLNFSTCIGTQQLNNTDFARLLSNAVLWAAQGSACVADLDDGSGTGTPDGGVTIDDLLYYLQIYADGVARADLDDGSGTGTHDGGVTIDDLLYYLQRFSAGC